jgi:hypothetical protein
MLHPLTTTSEAPAYETIAIQGNLTIPPGNGDNDPGGRSSTG